MKKKTEIPTKIFRISENGKRSHHRVSTLRQRTQRRTLKKIKMYETVLCLTEWRDDDAFLSFLPAFFASFSLSSIELL
jgi:hypothetical protein